MANVFQTSTGYRDANKAMTIKALEARAKAAQEAATASLQPTPVADPMQGIAGMLGTLGAQMQQGRYEAEASAGRNELARLQAGISDYGKIDPATLAQIGSLDPESQRFLQERMLAIQNREDEQTFKSGESELERKSRADLQAQREAFEKGESALTRGSTEGIANADRLSREKLQKEQEDAALVKQKDQQAAAAALQDDQQGAAAALQDDQQAATTASETHQSELRLGEKKAEAATAIENIPVAAAAREKEADRLGLKGAQREQYITTGDYTVNPPLKPADLFTPGQEVREKKLAEQATEWDSVGGAQAAKGITQVSQALNLLKTRPGITGFMSGAADYALPGFVNKWYNPDGTIARDAIRETVQMSLRQVLGSQFTQVEGEALMDRAFDMSLGPEENIRRATLLMEQIQTIARNKQAMSDELRNKGNFLSYAGGDPVDAAKLKELLDTDFGSGKRPATPGTGTGEDPNDPLEIGGG